MSSTGAGPASRRAWLLVPLALVLSAGVGFPIGSALGEDDPAPPPSPGPDPTGDVAADLDPCLVGSWRTTSHTEVYQDTVSGRGTLTGLDRTVQIAPDGLETITYGQTPATVTFTDGSTGQLQLTGTLEYDTAAADGAQTFALRSNAVEYTLTTPAGTQRFGFQPNAAPVSYECDEQTYRQFTDAGYESVMTRVDG